MVEKSRKGPIPASSTYAGAASRPFVGGDATIHLSSKFRGFTSIIRQKKRDKKSPKRAKMGLIGS